MKKQSIINLSILFIGALVISLGMTSCKKKSNGTSTGTFYIHLHTDIDTNEVADATTLYRDSSGRHFGLSVAQFYLSNVMVINANGTMYTIKDARILKNIDSEAYLVGTAPVGTYNSVMFDIGLDDATNAMTPTAFATTGYIPNSGMWFGNTSQGYMFMKLQGFADTTAAQSGTNLIHFSYEIGSSANRKTVTMPTRTAPSYQPYILTAGSTQYIHIICDYGKLLSVVNFKTQDSTDTYTLNPSIATTISNNIPNMFHYEE